MPAPFTRRLAGIRFVNQPPALPEQLPRMDIAAFVGFAAAGPLHRPVAVEDAAQFAAIFGDDLPLAWDSQKGAQTFACLAPAVRAFFRNGGRRCWVIRVAGVPETDRFPLPGLARIDGADLHPAFGWARSPGSWFDAFRAATALAVQPIEVLGWDTNTIHAVLGRQNEFRAGDLLRLMFTAEREEAFFVVQSVAPGAASPPDPHVAVKVDLLGTLKLLNADEISHQSFEVSWERSPQVSVSVFGNVVVTSPPNSDGDRVTLDVRPNFSSPPMIDVFSPPPGTLLQMLGSNGTRFLFQVEESEAITKSHASPPATAQIMGRVFSWSDKSPPAASSAPAGERLTFELRIRRSETNSVRLIDLGFAAAHRRFWNALPNDEQLFAEILDDDIYESLWEEAGESRFPISGGGDRKARFIPVGMSALAQPTMAAQNSGRSALERDGLDEFSSALFLDPRLCDSDVSTLIADADFIRYQTPGATRLSGIHAALEIEEASLIAVPDLMHIGWGPGPSPEAGSPPLSEPVPHLTWWRFLECDPPASPPGPYYEPDRGHFLRCDLRVLAPPDLSVDGPDISGRFTLNWTSPDSDAQFILQEATEPDFGDAAELRRGPARAATIFSHAPGHYYYRVRAEAGGESSNWSNGIIVQISAGTRWQVADATEFQPDVLLDVHRSLLRFCGALGDIMAVLALPEHFREENALEYLGDLKSPRPPTGNWIVRPLGDGEAAAFSYAAVYHPWLIVREEIGGLLRTPPDGAASGLIAGRSLARGAWIAPANETLTGVVSLTPRFGPERYQDLLRAQLNLIRQEPRGFLALNADTLSGDDELRPINVRRLLILLRRAALRLGMKFVFEPNDRTLRRVVQGAFESIMQQLFMRGAFAGATPDASYRVVTDDTLNTPRDFDQGRFRVDLKVAPALPMSFLTVRLIQMGERATATEII